MLRWHATPGRDTTGQACPQAATLAPDTTLSMAILCPICAIICIIGGISVHQGMFCCAGFKDEFLFCKFIIS